MTKQLEPDRRIARDRPVELKETGQSLEAIGDTRLQALEGGKDRLPFKGLVLAEGYVKGIIDIVLEYRDRASGNDGRVAKSAVYHVGYDSAGVWVDDLGTGHKRVAAHWQDSLVLIGDVEPVQIPQIVLPSRVGLHLSTDEVPDGFGGAVPRFYLSVNGTFNARPIIATKREPTVREKAMSVPFDENAVCVVKRSPEIVDGISKNGWKMSVRLGESDVPSLFEGALLMLGAESFSVFRNISPQKRFELVDVMVGPFYLE